MIILQPQQAVFVGVPRAGSKAISQWLESHFRAPGYVLRPAEAMNDYHATLQEVVQVYGYPLHTFWSFAFVRNPFDRLVSYCAMFDPTFVSAPQHSLRNALEEPVNRWTMPQIELVEGVKDVYRFERLQEAAGQIATRLGWVDAPPVPQDNEAVHEHYRAYYTSELRELAAQRYADDLSAFNYGF